MATYSGSDTYFDLTDWQGTKRAEASVGGCLTGWVSLPYGDNCAGAALAGENIPVRRAEVADRQVARRLCGFVGGWSQIQHRPVNQMA